MTNTDEQTSLQPMLSVDVVAGILSVSQKTVRRMIDGGVLPICRVGRLVRIQRSDLERYIASCTGR
jgi:excisionase family DNA binding protein